MKTETSSLDLQVAEKVFGFRKDSDGYWRSPDGNDAINESHRIFTKDYENALKVLDELRRRGYRILINMDRGGFHLRQVTWVHHNAIKKEAEYVCNNALGTAEKLEDLPEAICRAALKLLE